MTFLLQEFVKQPKSKKSSVMWHMLIDIHTHYGLIDGGYQMPLSIQLNGMKERGVDYALISNIECGIFHEGIQGNIKMLNMVRNRKDKLGCMLWCCENLDDKSKILFEDLYIKNQDIVKGFKIHPDISGKRADDECFDFFYFLAEKYSLPILFHTKDGQYSKVEYVENVALRFPNIILILGHLDLCSDGHKALNAIKKHKNIYGDTAWVEFDVIKHAAKMGITNKLMFGTDSPITGKECYGELCYRDFYNNDAEFMKDIMYQNAKRVFNLK